jgi:hypothetical protein
VLEEWEVACDKKGKRLSAAHEMMQSTQVVVKPARHFLKKKPLPTYLRCLADATTLGFNLFSGFTNYRFAAIRLH